MGERGTIRDCINAAFSVYVGLIEWIQALTHHTHMRMSLQSVIGSNIHIEVNTFELTLYHIWKSSRRFGFSSRSLLLCLVWVYGMYTISNPFKRRRKHSWVWCQFVTASMQEVANQNITWPRLLDEKPKRLKTFKYDSKWVKIYSLQYANVLRVTGYPSRARPVLAQVHRNLYGTN